MEKNVKRLLQENESKISFVIDGWSARNFDSFYGITVQYINHKWDVIAFAIDLAQSNGHHTGKNAFYFVRNF